MGSYCREKSYITGNGKKRVIFVLFDFYHLHMIFFFFWVKKDWKWSTRLWKQANRKPTHLKVLIAVCVHDLFSHWRHLTSLQSHHDQTVVIVTSFYTSASENLQLFWCWWHASCRMIRTWQCSCTKLYVFAVFDTHCNFIVKMIL